MILRIVPLSLVIALAACSGSSPDSAPPGGSPPPGSRPATPPAVSAEPPSPEEHGGVPPDPSAKSAPHGGTMVTLAEAAQLEFVLDGDKLTMYTFDADGRTPVRVTSPDVRVQLTPAGAAPASVTLRAVDNAATGEKAGNASRFEATSPTLAASTSVTGTVTSIEIRGQKFADVPFSVLSLSH